MTRLWSPDSGDVGSRVAMFAANRGGPPATASIVDVVGTPFDHVVRSLADLPTPVGSFINLTNGSWAFAPPTGGLNLGGRTIRIPSGVAAYLHGFGWFNPIISTAVPTLYVVGIAIVENLLALSIAGAQCVVVDGANALAILRNCSVAASGNSIEIDLAKYVQVEGGFWGSSFTGLYINGNVDSVQVSCVIDESTDYHVYYNTGAVRVAQFAQCVTRDSGATGIRWPAASAPSDGLTVVGCAYNTAAPFNGFTAASARVNVKACLNNAGLQSETAIVP
jgi:hypothetical protein